MNWGPRRKKHWIWGVIISGFVIHPLSDLLWRSFSPIKWDIGNNIFLIFLRDLLAITWYAEALGKLGSADFPFTCSTSYWEKTVDVSRDDSFYQFLLHVFWSCYWAHVQFDNSGFFFFIIKGPSLSLVIFFLLNSALSGINTAISAFLQLVFAYYIHICRSIFLFLVCLCLYIEGGLVERCSWVCFAFVKFSDGLCLWIGVLRLFSETI